MYFRLTRTVVKQVMIETDNMDKALKALGDNDNPVLWKTVSWDDNIVQIGASSPKPILVSDQRRQP